MDYWREFNIKNNKKFILRVSSNFNLVSCFKKKIYHEILKIDFFYEKYNKSIKSRIVFILISFYLSYFWKYS